MHSPISFGPWVKNRRKALGLTQEALANVVGCAPETLRKIEADRRRPSEQLVELLAGALDISPSERQVFMFLARGNGEVARTIAPAFTVPTPIFAALPTPLTPLVGREHELHTIHEMLLQPDIRLMTLLGPAGTGKTRLALEAGRSLHQSFGDGVYWIPLAAINDPDLVVPTISRAFDLRETTVQSLVAKLTEVRTAPTLLVLDNWEQVVAAAPLLADVLNACPWIKALVTSRVVLQVRGEHVYHVSPLQLPSLTNLPGVEALASVGAVKLFSERVRAIKPDWQLTPNNASVVARICVQLDGLPLALELAAARAKVLPMEALLERLGRRLSFLTGGAHDLPERQQSLRATLQWSYDLLPPAEQQLFARLGVFVGGFTLHSVEAICDADGKLGLDVLDGLTALVDNSLVYQLRDEGEPRFAMLETMRAYAVECLEAAPRSIESSVDGLHARHAHYYLTLVEQAELELEGAHGLAWLNRLQYEHDNLRAALQWSLEGEHTSVALRLAAALFPFWQIRGYLHEGSSWLRAALALPDADHAAPSKRLRIRALNGAGALAHVNDDHWVAVQCHEESVHLSRAIDDRSLLAQSLEHLAHALSEESELNRAAEHYQEAYELHLQLGNHRDIASAQGNLGYNTMVRGDFAAARTLLEESLATLRTLHDEQRMVWIISPLGRIAELQGDDMHARQLYEEGLQISRARGEKQRTVWTLWGLGRVALRSGNATEATHIFAESVVLSREIGSRGTEAASLYYAGRAAALRSDADTAWALLRDALQMSHTIDNLQQSILIIAAMGSVAFQEGDPIRAAHLWSAAEHVCLKLDAPLLPIRLLDFEASLAPARTYQGDAHFADAWAEYQETTVEQAIALGFA